MFCYVHAFIHFSFFSLRSCSYYYTSANRTHSPFGLLSLMCLKVTYFCCCIFVYEHGFLLLQFILKQYWSRNIIIAFCYFTSSTSELWQCWQEWGTFAGATFSITCIDGLIRTRFEPTSIAIGGGQLPNYKAIQRGHDNQQLQTPYTLIATTILLPLLDMFENHQSSKQVFHKALILFQNSKIENFQ